MPETITLPPVQLETKTKRPPLHKVMLVNDDFTPREFVVLVLKAVFRMDEGQASRVMMTAHQRGACVVAVFTREVAEEKGDAGPPTWRASGNSHCCSPPSRRIRPGRPSRCSMTSRFLCCRVRVPQPAPVGHPPALIQAWFDHIVDAVVPHADGSLPTARRAAEAYARRAKADNTRRAYRARGAGLVRLVRPPHPCPVCLGGAADLVAFLGRRARARPQRQHHRPATGSDPLPALCGRAAGADRGGAGHRDPGRHPSRGRRPWPAAGAEARRYRVHPARDPGADPG